MPSVLRSTLFLVVACGISAGLFAQQRFSSTTSLLTLDVSALDRDGNPVTDLAPEDFVVTLNEEIQPVRAMVLLATQNTTTAVTDRTLSVSAPRVPAVSAPVGANSEPDPRLMVILVDDLSIYPTDSKGLLVSAERFVDTIPQRDWVGLVSTSGRLNVNPSIDRTPLMAKLRRASGWMDDPRRDSPFGFVGFMDALEADQGSQGALRNLIETGCGLPPNLMATMTLATILSQYKCASDAQRQARGNAVFARVNTRNQLDMYAAVIDAMSSAPGVKQLVILTGGIALRPADSLTFVPIAKAAAAAGVQITILMEEPDGSDVSNPNALAFAKDQRRMMQQAQTLAEISGGQFFRVVGQADRFYRRVLTSASAIYRLGVELPTRVPPDGQYTVEVTVNRPGVRVLASRYAEPPPPAIAVTLTPEEQMKHAVTTGESQYAVQVQLLAEVVPGERGSPTAIRVSVDVPGDVPGPVSGFFGIVGPDQPLRGGRRDLVRSTDGKTYHLDLLVPATVVGTYDLRFAAADASGAVGAVTQKVVVRD
jgi:VWFA-related protein